jgi:hypothetical protein
MKTTSFLPDSLSIVEDTLEPATMAWLWRSFLNSLDLKSRRVKKHINQLEYIELDGVPVAAISYWYESDDDDYPTLRVDVDETFARERQQAFSDYGFPQLLRDSINDSKSWLESGDKLSSKDLKRIRRSAQKQIKDFFNPREE